MAWTPPLNGDPLPWLLEPGNPSVRYWTLTNVLGRSADNPEVQEARAAAGQQPLVQELFTRQHPDGHWGEDETKPYTAQGAVGVLSLLHTVGVKPNRRTVAGCDSFLRFSQHACGGFSMARTHRSGMFPCTTGEHLPFLVYFGPGEDPRVRHVSTFLIEGMATDVALDCSRYGHQDCLWGAIAALKGLGILPPEMHSALSEEAVRRLAGALVDADYDFAGKHKRWLSFRVPRAWGLLSALRARAAHGYAQDPRFTRLLDLLLTHQDEEGRWGCGSVSRTWPLEQRNRPSNWVTLDALRLLKAAA